MKLQNTLVDLNNHLFAEVERLSDEDLVGDNLVEEIGRAKAIKEISQQIISNASLALDAEKLKADIECRSKVNLPVMLEGKYE